MPSINLEKSVDRTFIAQPLDAPGKFKNLFITNKVTAHFLNSLYTSRVYTLNALSTDFSRINIYFFILLRALIFMLRDLIFMLVDLIFMLVDLIFICCSVNNLMRNS